MLVMGLCFVFPVGSPGNGGALLAGPARESELQRDVSQGGAGSKAGTSFKFRSFLRMGS